VVYPLTLTFSGLFVNTVTVLAAVSREDRERVGAMVLIVIPLIPFSQLSYSLSVGRIFEFFKDQFWVSMTLCSTYPLGIGIFKLMTNVIIGQLNNTNHNVTPVMELYSLAFAALPYRFIFLSVDSYTTCFAIMGIEICTFLYYCYFDFVQSVYSHVDARYNMHIDTKWPSP
jgi:hypothetical protein